jgi:hypothetical protein
MRLTDSPKLQDVAYKIKRNEKRPIKPSYQVIVVPPLGELRYGFVRFLYNRIVKQTDKARCFFIKGSGYWFPKSCSKIGLHPSGEWYVDVPISLAIEKGLVENRKI